jgi:hypothetical protein
MRSTSDGSLIIGQYAKTGERMLRGKRRSENLLSVLKDCIADDCEAQSKDFEWSISDHSSDEMKIQMNFKNSRGISKSVDGQDSIHFVIDEPEYFRSSNSDKGLKTENIKTKTACQGGAMICTTIPPQMKSQEEIDNIDSSSKLLGTSVSSVATSNFILVILMKGAIQQLMGLIRLL